MQPVWLTASMYGQSCVEVRHDYAGTLVRNSRHPSVVLRFDAEEWDTFVAGVVMGTFARQDPR